MNSVGYFPTHEGLRPGEIARGVEERGHAALWFAEHTRIPASRETQPRRRRQVRDAGENGDVAAASNSAGPAPPRSARTPACATSAPSSKTVFDPANLVDLQKAVVDHGADAGLAFDGDADRCFLIDERCEPGPPSAIVALIATRELTRDPGAAIVYNVITSKGVPEIVSEAGGIPVRCRVGHSFMKQIMAENNAIFGGEHSGHYCFRDFWSADTGILAAMHVLSALGNQDRPLAQLTSQYTRYVASGEINSQITNSAEVLDQVAAWFDADQDAHVDRLGGVTVIIGAIRFNLRPSNTEPMLSLNVEAPGHTYSASRRSHGGSRQAGRHRAFGAH